MSEYISIYQVHRHTCRHKNQRNKYVYITMKCQYVYEHTKYTKYVKIKYEYEHTKYISIYISIPSMS